MSRQVDSYLQPYVDGRNFAGGVLIARQGTVLVDRYYGMANYELQVENSSRTRFHIASVSKAFTAAAILVLESEGRLNTGEPISRWIPDLPRGERITLHHLLTHTSGIADINDAPFYEEESKKSHAPVDLVRLVSGLPPSFEPGERYEYSNSNYNLLAYVIERVSGESYGAFLGKAIFEPLGMADSGHDGDARLLIPNRASGYVPIGLRDLANAPWLDWSVKTGNGSLYTTTRDLLKFDQGLFGGRLLPKDAIDRILTAGSGNVYGWFVGEQFGRRRVRASGRSPGFTSSLEHYLDEQLTVIVLSNTYSTASQAIAEDLAGLALGQPRSVTMQITPIALPPSKLAVYEGSYAGGDDFFIPGVELAVTEHGNHLVMHWSSGADSILVPVADDEFLDRTFWAEVRFESSEGGDETKLVWSYKGDKYSATRGEPRKQSVGSPPRGATGGTPRAGA